MGKLGSFLTSGPWAWGGEGGTRSIQEGAVRLEWTAVSGTTNLGLKCRSGARVDRKDLQRRRWIT